MIYLDINIYLNRECTKFAVVPFRSVGEWTRTVIFSCLRPQSTLLSYCIFCSSRKPVEKRPRNKNPISMLDAGWIHSNIHRAFSSRLHFNGVKFNAISRFLAKLLAAHTHQSPLFPDSASRGSFFPHYYMKKKTRTQHRLNHVTEYCTTPAKRTRVCNQYTKRQEQSKNSIKLFICSFAVYSLSYRSLCVQR